MEKASGRGGGGGGGIFEPHEFFFLLTFPLYDFFYGSA